MPKFTRYEVQLPHIIWAIWTIRYALLEHTVVHTVCSKTHKDSNLFLKFDDQNEISGEVEVISVEATNSNYNFDYGADYA